MTNRDLSAAKYRDSESFHWMAVGPTPACETIDVRTTVDQISSDDVVYDALDYRLMATFPASDATAQY